MPFGQYQFLLGDFGLCNRAVNAMTRHPIFMASEIRRKEVQTPKADVWSLFVTMVYTLDAGKFRQRSIHFKTDEQVTQGVLSAASKADIFSIIQEMAIVNPQQRASAAQMLVKIHNGVGLTTPRNRVPALIVNRTLSKTQILTK